MPSHTFLFADIVDFTALTAVQGDDAGADVALDLEWSARDLAAECGADFVKAMGDAVMVHGLDPEETVRLGLRLSEELFSHPARQLIRAGVNSGPAVGRRGDWFGMTVNVAARIAAHARGGELLIGESTAQAVSPDGDLVLVDRGRWLPRGALAPIRIFTAREARERELGLAIAV
jgi:adenylate cyclase